MFDYCRKNRDSPYDISMKAIKKELGFLLARPWCAWEILEKVFPKSILQQPQKREECLGDLLEALNHGGFITVK